MYTCIGFRSGALCGFRAGNAASFPLGPCSSFRVQALGMSAMCKSENMGTQCRAQYSAIIGAPKKGCSMFEPQKGMPHFWKGLHFVMPAAGAGLEMPRV